MCDFCENFGNLCGLDTDEMLIGPDVDGEGYFITAICYRKDGDTVDTFSHYINYCPICRRTLFKGKPWKYERGKDYKIVRRDHTIIDEANVSRKHGLLDKILARIGYKRKEPEANIFYTEMLRKAFGGRNEP